MVARRDAAFSLTVSGFVVTTTGAGVYHGTQRADFRDQPSCKTPEGVRICLIGLPLRKIPLKMRLVRLAPRDYEIQQHLRARPANASSARH
jgi:hypothetical protein